VLTQLVGQREVGEFMISVAALTIAAQSMQLGANIGLSRFVPSMIARNETGAIGRLLVNVFGVVAVAGVIGAIGVAVIAEPLADLLGSDSGQSSVEYIRAMAIFVPFATLFLLSAQCTQAFGTMTAAAVIDKIGRPVIQVIAVAGLATVGTRALVAAYGMVYAVGVIVFAVVIWRLVAELPGTSEPGQDFAPPLSEFWRFSLPRAVAATFQVTILWADTILIGFLRSIEEAAVYSVATRYLVVGNLVVGAVLQAMTPRLARQLAVNETRLATRLYQRSATWVVTVVWPSYIVVAVFAPLFLQIFGDEYLVGTDALRIVAVAMMVSGACGAVDTVLLMAGKSWLSVANWGAGLTVNITLNLILIPRLGIRGAAIAWAASILVRNVLPVFQVRHLFGMQPVSRPYLNTAAAALLLVGIPSILAATFLGMTIGALLIGVVPGGIAYLATVGPRLRTGLAGTDDEG